MVVPDDAASLYCGAPFSSIGMQAATGKSYRHVLELLAAVTG